MKKSISLSIIIFLISSILQLILNIIINEQIISRILYGVDYNTYFMNYYSNQVGFIGLISGTKMPFEWVFSISKYVIAIFCCIMIFITVKKLKTKYKLTLNNFITTMVVFSLLSLYEVIIYIINFHAIPTIKFFVFPFLFIITTFISIYKFMYKTNK